MLFSSLVSTLRYFAAVSALVFGLMVMAKAGFPLGQAPLTESTDSLAVYCR